MAFQVSPGINITEQDLTTVVPNVSASVGGYAGAFQWGPVDERTTISSENELVDVFGKPDSNTFQDFWTAANYLAYSNNLVVVRSVATAATNAVIGDTDGTGTAIDVHNKTHYDSVLSTFTDQAFVAKYPGALGNSLKAMAIDAHGWAATVSGSPLAEQNVFKANFDRAPGTSTDVTNAGGSNDEMHVIVIDEDGQWTGTPGFVLEKFAYVSKASDAKKIDGASNYVGDVLRNESKYIWLGKNTQLTATSTDSGSEVDAGSTKVGSTFKSFNSATEAEKYPGGSLAGGVDGNTLTQANRQAGYAFFQTAEAVDVSLIMTGPADAVTSSWVTTNVADARKDCMVFVSPLQGSVVNNAGSEVTSITTDHGNLVKSSYAVMDSAWKYQYDRFRDAFVYVPLNGDIAGLCARTDNTNDPWWSPAGLTRGIIKNIVKLSWEPTKANRDTLYQLGVNPSVTQAGAGVILFGDKTMQTVPSAFDRINVRRLFITLEKSISVAAKAMLFEFNDEFTRTQFVNFVTPFLREVQGRRGITDFKVVCDGSNNPGEVIDTNQFVGDIFVKPARSINYIQLNFIAARTDVNFTEIGG